MLERLAQTFIAGVELLEAEGRAARARLLGLAAALLTASALTIAGLLGTLALLVGLTWLIALEIGWPVALCIVGGAIAITTGFALQALIHAERTPDQRPARSGRLRRSTNTNANATTDKRTHSRSVAETKHATAPAPAHQTRAQPHI